ncbi:hypothetical protein FF125_06220 [Aureibaculum algae]|uniref:ATP-binding protein n=1 Tax=Aureibaculum algae TaxID=2584122 RepID=A0A5B7TTQ4_9FLAO|nr:DUF6493 family protein [Aureibaculum algae]QCX38042.1 hypothetical protein FF125_06220 [Aureibaculum algae]
MKKICKDYELRIKNEEVTGTCNWIKGKVWEERKYLDEHLLKLSTENYTAKQSLILRIVARIHSSVLNIKELDIDLQTLDDVDIAELIVFYNLENPEKRYQEIKADIASPESFLTRIPYSVIRELYNRGKVPFDRQIFVACLTRFNVWHGASYSKDFKEGMKEKFYAFFPQDDFTIDILMAVFEMELGVDSAFFLDREFNIAAIIIELVTSGRIPRATIQQKLFEAFNNPTLKQTTHGWAKNIYRDLAFTAEENSVCQNQLIQLLYNDRNLLVNFGLQELKKIANHKSFDWNLFINSLDGIVYSEKLTGGLKTALAILYKGLKKDKNLVELCCVNLAPIFLQEDNKVQLAAQKCYELLPEPNEEVKEALLPFIDTMHSEVKSALSALLGESEVAVSYDTYLQKAYIPEPCNAKNKIQYIDSEDDFIFLTSKVLKSNDVLDYELFLEGILRYYNLKDTNYKTLQPALKQAKRIAEEQYLDITARVGVHHVMVAELICMWLSPTPSNFSMEKQEWEQKVKKEDRFLYTANRWYALYYRFKRVVYVLDQIQLKKVLPLLSTPTHNHFEIDPIVFFERLELYKKVNQIPNETDFCTAMCRLNRWSPIPKERPSISQEHDDILAFLLDDKASFNPQKIKNLDSIWLTAYTLKNPNKAIEATISKHENQDWYKTPTEWDWTVARRYSEDRKYSWAYLEQNIKHADIYTVNVTQNSYLEHHLTNTEFIIADVSHWFSRDGYLQDPLYVNLILNAFNYLSDIEASETKSILEVVKYNAEHPVPLHKAGYLFLTLSLFCSKTPIRTGAFDWLELLITHQYLNLDEFTLATSKLVANEANAIPMARVAEQFDRLFQLKGVFIDVLHQTIEVILTNITLENIPKGFSKILHYYYEVLQIVNKPIPKNIAATLHKMQQINSIKKEVKKILSLYE